MKLNCITKKKYLKYEDNNAEYLKSNDRIIIWNKNTNRYYETHDLERYENIPWYEYKPKIKNSAVCFRLVMILVFFVVNVVFYFLIHTSIHLNILRFAAYSTIYTLLQVFFHECSHILALHRMKRKIDKIGFKFNYIFPSFYIRMNEMYMLSETEKIYIHSAGIFFNCVSNGIILIISWALNISILNIVSQFFVIGLLMNVLPVLNSDGYKLLLTFLSFNEHKQKQSNSILIRLFSYLNILISIVYFIVLVINNT